MFRSVPSGSVEVVVHNLVDGFDVYDMESGRLLHMFKQEELDCISLPCVTTHGNSAIVSGSSVGNVRIWDLNSGTKVTTIAHRGLYRDRVGDDLLIKLIAVSERRPHPHVGCLLTNS